MTKGIECVCSHLIEEKKSDWSHLGEKKLFGKLIYQQILSETPSIEYQYTNSSRNNHPVQTLIPRGFDYGHENV